MSGIALYTFGLLDPTAGAADLKDFGRRGREIYGAVERAPGFLGRPTKVAEGPETHTPGEDYGPWGAYALPDVPSFAGHDRQLHIATLSAWRDLESARAFVYNGLHRDALTIRYNWFLKGSWPGHVLWTTAGGVIPSWSDGVTRYEALARDGVSPDRFCFGSQPSPE